MCNILHFLLHDPSLEESISIEPTFLETYTAEELEAVKSPRILPTHMRPDLLPADVFKRGRKITLRFEIRRTRQCRYIIMPETTGSLVTN